MTTRILRKLLDIIRREMSSDRMMVLLMDETYKVLFQETRPLSLTEGDEIGMDIVRRTLELRQPMIIEDISKDPRFFDRINEDVKQRGSVLCVPFMLDNKALGALSLRRTNTFNSFSCQNINFLLPFLRPIKSILKSCVDLEGLDRNFAGESVPLLVGKGEAFHRLRTLIERIKDRDAPAFICGESGTGKEVVARAIHQTGIRRMGKFVAVNCGAIPDLLLESELFGYARGAFTGAMRNKPGLIEEADGGTFFLDEICDLSLHLQAKLLRLLQENEIRRIGENHTRRVNARFISATNKNIEDQMRSGHFREDLYYRLKIITIELSPLRDRQEDLFFLLNYFLDKFCQEMKRERAYFSPRALELLMNYTWPGNVRELQSEIQRCLILAGDDELIKEDILSSKINPQGKMFTPMVYRFSQAKDEFEKRFLNQTLARWGYNRAKTAKNIGLSRQGLFKLIKKHNISVPKKSGETDLSDQLSGLGKRYQ